MNNTCFFLGGHVSTDFDPADCARGLLTLIKSWLKGHGLWKCGFMPNFCQMRLPPAMAQVSYVHITWTNSFCCSPGAAVYDVSRHVSSRARYSTVTLSVWGSHISMWWLITKKNCMMNCLIILYNSLTFLDKTWWNHVSFLAGIQFSGICISCSDMNGAGHWGYEVGGKNHQKPIWMIE